MRRHLKAQWRINYIFLISERKGRAHRRFSSVESGFSAKLHLRREANKKVILRSNRSAGRRGDQPCAARRSLWTATSAALASSSA
jgi:hypothetical protein